MKRSLALTLLAGALGACEVTVTSVGAWDPITEPPAASGGQSGGGGTGGTAGGADGPAGQAGEPRQSQYLEAEDGELSGGFAVVSDASASNGAYLEPPLGVFSDDAPGEARARYRFTVPEEGTYRIWGRIYSPTATNNRFWFQVDGGTWYRWRISTGEIWYWDAFHDDVRYDETLDFALTAGDHELVIANCASGAKLDRLYVTSLADEPPGNDTPCRPPHSIEVGGECLDSCGSYADEVDRPTTCVVSECQGQALLDAYDCNICCYEPELP